MKHIIYAMYRRAGVAMLHRQTDYQANDFYLNTDFNTIKSLIVNKLTKSKYEVLQNTENILAIRKGPCVIRVNSIGNVEVFSNDSSKKCNDYTEIKVIQDAFKSKIPDFEIINKKTEDMVARIKGMPIKVVAAPSSFAGIKSTGKCIGVSAESVTKKVMQTGCRKISKSGRGILKNENAFNPCTDTNRMK